MIVFLAPVGSALSLFLVGCMKSVKCSLLLFLLVDFPPTELLLEIFFTRFSVYGKFLIRDEVVAHHNKGV